eukprot:TCALIF_09050-PA protein Name:"Similar to SUN1 SUN domain-containing protein 1 (Homo sapiens)" AED:0.36 eAED:0.36 QI:0/0/0/0.25/1/1/4/0/1059
MPTSRSPSLWLQFSKKTGQSKERAIVQQRVQSTEINGTRQLRRNPQHAITPTYPSMASSSHGGRRPRGESPFVLRSQCKGQLCDRATPTHTHRHSRRSSRLASTAVVEPSLSKDNGFMPNGGLNETVNGHQPPGSPRLDAFDGEGWVRTPRTGYTYAESQTYLDHCSKEVPMPHMARLPLWGSGERAARPDVHLELVETYDSVLAKGLRTVVYAIPAWCSLLDTYLLKRNPANLAKRPYLDGNEDEDELLSRSAWIQICDLSGSLLNLTTSAIVSVPSLMLPWASLIIEAPVIAIRLILMSLTDNFILDGVQSAMEWSWNTLKSWGSMPLTLGQGLVHLIPSVGYRAYEGFTNIPMLPSLVLPWASFIIEAPVLVIRRMLLYLADNAFDAFSTLFERSHLATTTFAEYPVNFALWTMNSLTTTGAFLWNGIVSIGSITAALPQLTLTWASLIVETPVALMWSLLDVSINIVESITSVPIGVTDLAFQGISWIGSASENGMASFSSGFEKIFHYLSIPLGYVGATLWNLPISTCQLIWSVTGFVWNWFWYQGQTISEAVLSGSDYWVTSSESMGQTGLSLISRIPEWISWPFSKSFEQVGNFGTLVAETTSFLSAMSSEVTETGGMALSFLFAPLLGTWNWLTHMDIVPIEDSSETKKIDVIDVKIQRLINLNMLETKVNDYLQKGISDWETKFQSDLEQTQSFLGIKSLDETSFDGKYPQFEIETPDFSLKIRDLNLDHTMEDENLTKDVYLHKDKLLTKLAALKELFIMSNDRIRDCCNKADFPMWISHAGKKNLESYQEALGLLNQNLATTQDLIPAIKDLKAKVLNDFNILLGDELKKQAKAQVLEEIQTLINLNVGQLNKINEKEVAKVVAAAIAKYDADKTGLFDYAAESAGASVVSIRCSETYTSRARRLSLFGIPFWTFSWGPRVAIQNGLIPGQCWAFKGSQGYLVIQLSRPLKPQKFSMEHIPRNLTPNGRLDSAPKDFQVLGLRELHDQDPIQLGNFTYVLEGESNQFFDSSLNLEEEMRLRFVELRILSNHGNMNYTCLYRFRVHGQN